MKRPAASGQTELILEPVEFLRRLAALVPPPRVNLVRFFGFFAPNSSLRKHLVPKPPKHDPPVPAAPSPASTPSNKYRFLGPLLAALPSTSCTPELPHPVCLPRPSPRVDSTAQWALSRATPSASRAFRHPDSARYARLRSGRRLEKAGYPSLILSWRSEPPVHRRRKCLEAGAEDDDGKAEQRAHFGRRWTRTLDNASAPSENARMTPLNPHAPRSSSSFTAGLSLGLAITLVIACLGSALGYVYVKRSASNARKGWNLVPVVVAAVDITEDTVVTMDMISQRSIPEQFVTASIVKPDSASYIVSQKVLVPLQAGDPLLWSQFETKKLPLVLFAKSDLPLGSAIDAAQLEERAVSQDLLTPSWVRTEDRPQAVGKKLIAPFRKGDPILWTHLEAQAP